MRVVIRYIVKRPSKYDSNIFVADVYDKHNKLVVCSCGDLLDAERIARLHNEMHIQLLVREALRGK
jgi:hypothetical protein